MTNRSRLVSEWAHRAHGLDFLLLAVLFGTCAVPSVGRADPTAEFVALDDADDDEERGPVWLPPDAPKGAAVDFERHAASFPIESVDQIDLDNTLAVFAHVFAHLPAEGDILPTENYFYWRFHTADKYIWGNLRLGPDSRDQNQVHFGYYEFGENVTGPEDAHARYRVLGPEDGIKTAKIDNFTYDVTFNNRSVRFHLNQLSQAPPTSYALAEDEAFVFNTQDESNTQFNLLFNTRTNNFMFVAKEDERPLDQVELINDELALDRGTGFLYYLDAEHGNRKVLIGVYRRNVAQNNYFDGPADQLADNFIPSVPEYKGYLNAAYPFTRGVIDQYGFFADDPGNRVAVAPYYSYTTIGEMESMVATCQSRGDVGDMMSCLLPGGYDADRNSSEPPTQLTANGEPLMPLAGLNYLPGMLATLGLAGNAAVPVANSFDVFIEDWENGLNGWTATGLWHIVHEPPTSCPPDLNYKSPISSAYYGVDASCSYNAGITHGYLTSPATIPLPEDSFLEFWYRRDTQEWTCGVYDKTYIEIMADNGPWELLYTDICDESSRWVHVGPIDLHAYKGKQVRIRFVFDSVDGNLNNALGWMVDDIHIASGPVLGGQYASIPTARHNTGVTWHMPGLTFIPPGTKHNSGSTWHYAGQTFIPAGSKHNSGVTWHVAGQTFIPPGTIHNSGVTWHVAGQTFIPAGTKHNSGVTWHVNGISFIPPGTKHNSGVTWHVTGQTFIPAGAKHNTGVTWHVPGVSFIPAGTKHNSGVTWHVNGVTFIPPGSKHNSGSTWHVAGITFIPPGTKHNSGVTWHVAGATFIPPGTKHNTGSTWHVAGQSFIPPGTKHNSGSTWHYTGQSFIPPGTKHNSGSTWHYTGQSFIPPGSKHNSGSTWHYAGQSFIPPGTKHNSGSTWHYSGQSFIPPGSKHNSGSTWHLAGQSFIPPGTIHNTGSTWHVAGQSFIPPGTKHNSGSTWHVAGASFIPQGAKHNAGVTWHITNVTFIPANAKHLAGTTWHQAGVTFLLMHVAGLSPAPPPPPPPPHQAGVTILPPAPPQGHVVPLSQLPEIPPQCQNNSNCPSIGDCYQGVCSSVDGQCEYYPTPGEVCDDGDPTTQGDTCNNYGSCVGSPAVGQPCDDGKPCTVNDTINPQGVCQGVPAPQGSPCDSGNHCIAPGSSACDNGGQCVGGSVMTGAPCNDGDAFTQNDTCRADGGCYGQVTLPCGGTNNCVADTQCDSVTGQVTTTAEVCDDTCAGQTGSCDPSTACQFNAAPICDQANDAQEGECNNGAGGCVTAPIDCDDGNSCTQDFVDPQGNCTHSPFPDGTVCDDGNACTLQDTCQASVCVSSQSVTCPGCTACDSETGTCSDLSTCPQSVSITQWRSVRTHNGTTEWAIVLDSTATGNGNSGPTIETRGPNSGPGVQKVEIDFSGTVSLVNPGNVAVTYRVTTPGGPPIMGGPISTVPASVTMLDADTMTITFNVLQIPNMSCININLGPGTLSEVISGDSDCNIRSLYADANGSGTVTIADQLATKLKNGAPIATNAKFDLNVSGAITIADQLAAKTQLAPLTKTALCP